MSGPDLGIISGEIFEKETMMCGKLNRDNGGKCSWGKCADCGVIPLLVKLRDGKLLETEDEINRAKKEVFAEK